MACSKCSYTGTAGNEIQICEDLLTEIIVRLPPKSLFRFRCVSKAWRRLISSDYVQKKLPFTISGIYSRGSDNHFKRQYACMSDGKFVDSSLSFFPFGSNSRVISCCNGLLLFQSLLYPTFQVCNPATKRWFTLPSPKKIALLSVLAFDPGLSRHYSVICFTGWQMQGAELEVFSSETGRWDEFNVCFGVEPGTLSINMSYFNGVLYLLSHLQCIVCVRLATMTCQRIGLPEPAKAGAHVGKNGGRFCYYSGSDKSEASVWMLQDLGSCRWELKHLIRFKAITKLDSSRFLAFHPESELVYFLVSGKLVSYDMGKERIEEVGDFGMEKGRGCLVQIWPFQFSNCLSDCLLVA